MVWFGAAARNNGRYIGVWDILNYVIRDVPERSVNLIKRAVGDSFEANELNKLIETGKQQPRLPGK
jgi:hypothetical protein